jgi:transposase
MNPSYPSNLTNEQWELLSELIPQAKTGGRKRSVDMQAIVCTGVDARGFKVEYAPTH